MKRLHVHISVDDLTASIRFYNALFAAEPTVSKPDYAKWMLDDPRVNFAISTRSAKHGVNHLGIQVDSAEELDEIAARAQQGQLHAIAEPGAQCCYAQSNKHWITDPQGVVWEAFHSMGEVAVYGNTPETGDSCCAPAAKPRIKLGEASCSTGTGCC
ncbi:ArsI/CadI family heavy metal resistance metalloenzyme [Chitinimonas sp. BJYL2]|uniref:ArsI/CadI family heavy metal resistance metalloenzyme n=1 Tax=Chitinimonas sp. BJYL2 TaxID=2976696 RepID=UPI0022B2B58E|nr:ArsI/CadI family heavy metal resistance metalloenzyme [Chitinimonas sp. BJYL2]